MKDVASMLSQHTPKPKRELTPAFTQTVLSEIQQHPNGPPKPARIKLFLYFLKTAPGIALIAIILALSGIGTYAAVIQTRDNTNGATIEISPDDPTVITLDLKNCRVPLFHRPEGPTPLGREPTYNGPTKFKIIQPDIMPATKVKATILAWCEQQSVRAFYGKTHPLWFPEDTSPSYDQHFGEIISTTPDSITIKYAWGRDYETATYPRQAALVVYKDGRAVAQDTLRAGDNAVFIIHQPKDTTAPNWKPSTPNASNSTLVSIAQTEYNVAEYSLFEATNRRVFAPLNIYNEYRALEVADTFYRKTYPAWFDSGAAPYHSMQRGDIKAITSTTITITLPVYTPQKGERNVDITYPISNSLTIYDNGKRVEISSLKAGDRALFIIALAPGAPYNPPDGPSPTNTSLISIAKL
jgi:hypothetical protein